MGLTAIGGIILTLVSGYFKAKAAGQDKLPDEEERQFRSQLAELSEDLGEWDAGREGGPKNGG